MLELRGSWPERAVPQEELPTPRAISRIWPSAFPGHCSGDSHTPGPGSTLGFRCWGLSGSRAIGGRLYRL